MLVAELNRQLVCARTARAGKDYRCPECHSRLVLRQGKWRIAHFAHCKDNNGCSMREGESYEHLLGKQQIFEWARKKEFAPQLEVYLAEIDQRADIMINVNGQRVAIEFQCSPLATAALQKRTAGYRQMGISCYWLLGSPYKKKLHQRHTEKFLQLFRHRRVLLFWDVHKKRLRVIHPEISKQAVSLYGVGRDQRLLKDLLLEQVEGTNTLLPLICHQRITGITFTRHPEIYWRVLAVAQLKRVPLFTRFSFRQWYGFLREIQPDEWMTFPCLPQDQLITLYLTLFTNELVSRGYLLVAGNQFIVFQHPQPFKSLAAKYQAIENEQNHPLKSIKL